MSELDIFNLDGEMFVDKKPESGKDSGFYKPYPENGKDGVYSSLVRFLPNQADPELSKIHKYYVYLTDPTTGNGLPVDCPSTVGKKSILKDMFWKLKNSNSAADQDLAKNFSRKEDYYSLIQVIKDSNNPELEGKIVIFKYGKKLNEKLEAQLKPSYGDPVNPFDLFNGKVFSLSVRKVGEWNNYDQCSFVGDRAPIEIEGRPMQKNQEDMATIIDYLKTGPQNLSSFAYQDWDTETTNKVMEIIKNTVPDARVVNEVIGGAKASPPSAPPAQSPPATDVREDNFYKEASSTNVGNSAPAATPVSAPATAETASSLDDLYKDL